MQNKTKLVLELFGEPAAGQSIKNRANHAGALLLGQLGVFETPLHHRTRPAVPEPFRLRLDKGHTLLHGINIPCKQAVTQCVQLHLAQRLEPLSLGFHRDGPPDAFLESVIILVTFPSVGTRRRISREQNACTICRWIIPKTVLNWSVKARLGN